METYSSTTTNGNGATDVSESRGRRMGVAKGRQECGHYIISSKKIYKISFKNVTPCHEKDHKCWYLKTFGDVLHQLPKHAFLPPSLCMLWTHTPVPYTHAPMCTGTYTHLRRFPLLSQANHELSGLGFVLAVLSPLVSPATSWPSYCQSRRSLRLQILKPALLTSDASSVTYPFRGSEQANWSSFCSTSSSENRSFGTEVMAQ